MWRDPTHEDLRVEAVPCHVPLLLGQSANRHTREPVSITATQQNAGHAFLLSVGDGTGSQHAAEPSSLDYAESSLVATSSHSAQSPRPTKTVFAHERSVLQYNQAAAYKYWRNEKEMTVMGKSEKISEDIFTQKKAFQDRLKVNPTWAGFLSPGVDPKSVPNRTLHTLSMQLDPSAEQPPQSTSFLPQSNHTSYVPSSSVGYLSEGNSIPKTTSSLVASKFSSSVEETPLEQRSFHDHSNVQWVLLQDSTSKPKQTSETEVQFPHPSPSSEDIQLFNAKLDETIELEEQKFDIMDKKKMMNSLQDLGLGIEIPEKDADILVGDLEHHAVTQTSETRSSRFDLVSKEPCFVIDSDQDSYDYYALKKQSIEEREQGQEHEEEEEHDESDKDDSDARHYQPQFRSQNPRRPKLLTTTAPATVRLPLFSTEAQRLGSLSSLRMVHSARSIPSAPLQPSGQPTSGFRRGGRLRALRTESGSQSQVNNQPIYSKDSATTRILGHQWSCLELPALAIPPPNCNVKPNTNRLGYLKSFRHHQDDALGTGATAKSFVLDPAEQCKYALKLIREKKQRLQQRAILRGDTDF